MSDSSRSRRKRSRHNDPDGAGPSRDAAFKVTVSGGHRYPPKLVEQWRQGTLCDCTIVVDPETFSGHRNVLAAASGYFAGLYSGAGVVMRERNGGPAQLEGMSPEVFGAALEFMYTGECGLPETMLTELLQAASRLQVEDLLRATTQALALKERLQPSNCLAIWELAERLGLAELQEHARESATRDFEKLQSSPESLFLSLPHARLATLLADMNLNVESEDAAFQAMVAWARHQQPAPSEAELEQLLSLIRFPRMTRAFLVDVEPLLLGHPRGAIIYAQSFREVQFCDDTPRAKKRLVRLSASNVKYTDLKAEMAVRICGEMGEVKQACEQRAPGASEAVEWNEDMVDYFEERHRGAGLRIRKISQELQAAELEHPSGGSDHFWFPFNVLARAARLG
ncbi:hypothetical protein EMIHUDRAFT_371011, partial [Emiliania huxleyi CCMP1516]|uniref:BTB domain-containing protein n=2 Tax=Emiliania huxleyi TaxID=2903 RepID=A0A0D3IR04_EMIH1